MPQNTLNRTTCEGKCITKGSSPYFLRTESKALIGHENLDWFFVFEKGFHCVDLTGLELIVYNR